MLGACLQYLTSGDPSKTSASQDMIGTVMEKTSNSIITRSLNELGKKSAPQGMIHTGMKKNKQFGQYYGDLNLADQ